MFEWCFAADNDKVYKYVVHLFIRNIFSWSMNKRPFSATVFVGCFDAKSGNSLLADVYTVSR